MRCGEVIGLAGLEGSGQQLLMQALAGLAAGAGGPYSMDGQDLTGQSYDVLSRQGVALVPAARLEEGMIPGLDLREHVALSHATARA